MTNVFNKPQRLSQESELRCQSCNKWLDERDLRCGLSLYCVDCCTEPAYMHDEPLDEEEHAAR